MKRSTSTQLMAINQEKSIALTQLVKGINLCVHEVSHTMPSIFPAHSGLQSFHAVQKKILKQADDGRTIYSLNAVRQAANSKFRKT